MQDKFWFFDDAIDGEDLSMDECIPDIATGDTAAPLALPVTRGDRIEIHYPDDLDADISIRDNPEVWHYGGLAEDAVALHTERAHEAAMDEPYYAPNGRTSEGIYRFNKRVQVHAEKVCIERVEVPTVGDG